MHAACTLKLFSNSPITIEDSCPLQFFSTNLKVTQEINFQASTSYILSTQVIYAIKYPRANT